MYDNGAVYAGGDATFDALGASSGAVIVLATHGTVSPSTHARDLATLELAGPDGKADPVSAMELLFGLHLHSPLIVLFACEAHGTRPDDGENWAGLTRAFLRSTPALLSSLWRIDAPTTLAFSVPFWEAMRDGYTVPQAGADRDAGDSANR